MSDFITQRRVEKLGGTYNPSGTTFEEKYGGIDPFSAEGRELFLNDPQFNGRHPSNQRPGTPQVSAPSNLNVPISKESPFSLGSDIMTGGSIDLGTDMPIWEGATQEDTEMSQWMSSGSNLDFASWLSAGKPEAFDTSPLVSSPTTSQPDYNSMSGPEMTAYFRQKYPEQYSSEPSSSDQPDYNSMTGPELNAYLKQQYPEQYSSDSSSADSASNTYKKYLDELNVSQRQQINDLWNRSQSSGQNRDLSRFEWIHKNWDSFSDVIGNSGGQKQIPAPDNRTVPITKELPKMFDERQVPISKAPPKIGGFLNHKMFDNINKSRMKTESTPIAQKPQDKAISAMQPNTMKTVAKDNYTSAGMKENKTLTDQRQATTDARQAAFQALKKRRMQ